MNLHNRIRELIASHRPRLATYCIGLENPLCRWGSPSQKGEPGPDNRASGIVDPDRIYPPGPPGSQNGVPVDTSGNPALPEPDFRGSLGLMDPVTEQSDLAVVWWGTERSLD
jgi:hypothetical protein